MKLLSLNLWGGLKPELLPYIREQSKDTDIFCFQEVYDTDSGVQEVDGFRAGLLGELKQLLPDFDYYYEPTYWSWVNVTKVDFKVSEGQATFVRRSLKILETDARYIYGDKSVEIRQDFTNEPKNVVGTLLEANGKQLFVANVHGLWFPGDKHDTPDRIKQSEIILEFVKGRKQPTIICGDFNLEPETESVKILERAGYRNLIREYNITNTRNENSWLAHNNKQYYADFTFTTPDVQAKKFEVPHNLVSDHLPMILEFEI